MDKLQIKAGKYMTISARGTTPTYFIDKRNGTFSDFSTGRFGKTESKPEEKMERTWSEKRIFEINSAACKLFCSNRKDIAEYCKKRELSQSDQERFLLGYAADTKKLPFSEEELLRAGLLKKKEDGSIVNVFWKRMMFPIYDADGNIIAFGGRVLEKDAKVCKYLNTGETEVFRKRDTLYMYHVAKEAKCDSFILCEGYMDVISMHKAGLINAVGAMGTSLTPAQVEMLKVKPHVYCMFDSDEAGINAAKRNIPPLIKEGIVVKVVNLTPYKDPDELLCKAGRNEMLERLKDAITGRDFLRMHYKEGDNPEIIRAIMA